MSDTTVTVSQPLKDHLKTLRQTRELTSLNETIKSILITPVEDSYDVPEGNIDVKPAPIKVTDETLSLLKRLHEERGNQAYEDTLREQAGATLRTTGEEPIEWDSLE